jgi:serine/threonine-protein kinase RsbW
MEKPIPELEQLIKLELPACYKYLNLLGATLGGILERVDNLAEPDVQAYNLSLAVHEICTNIIDHSYLGESSNRIWLEFRVEGQPSRLVIDLKDSGLEFNPLEEKEPDLENGQIHGYGLFLVHQLVDNLTYKRQNNFNQWQLVKNLS